MTQTRLELKVVGRCSSSYKNLSGGWSNLKEPPPPLVTYSIILTAKRASLPVFFFQQVHKAAGQAATCLSASPPSVRITPLKWSTLWRSPGGTMNPPPSFRDKPSTAIQISTVDSFGLQAASSYRPTLLRGAGWRGLSFDLLSCSSGDSPP